MRLIRFLMILLVSFLSPNYTAQPVPQTNRVVTQIEVQRIHDGQTTVSSYSDPEHMESILTYLRLTEPYVTVLYEPDSFRSDSYTFYVNFSDGTQNVYRQIYRDYLQKNGGRWQRISDKADLHFPVL